MQNLSERWLELWQRIGAKGNALEFFNDLKARYSEPHRSYHNLSHLKFCLDEFDKVRHLAQYPDAVELAIWYHDAIYDTKSQYNEEKSIILAVKMMKHTTIDNHFIQSVALSIFATKHTVTASKPDTQLVVDIDLSIFGQTAKRYSEYEKRIRIEYNWVSVPEFIHGRSKILRQFLDRENIYLTECFRDKYEAKARENLAHSLTRLSNYS